MIGFKFAALVLALGIGTTALATDASERKFIREGMGEGEVLLRIGKPDHEAFIRIVQGEPEEKAWSYFPRARDPQTLTIVTFHAGVVTRVERKISR
jgi:hypothetical protein